MSKDNEIEARINPMLLGKGVDFASLETFYQDENYKILGPIGDEGGYNSLGFLFAELSFIRALNNAFKNIPISADHNRPHISFLSILTLVSKQPPHALVVMPRSEYVNLGDFPPDDAFVRKILKKERDREIYKQPIEAKDFWQIPDSENVMLTAIHKLLGE